MGSEQTFFEWINEGGGELCQILDNIISLLERLWLQVTEYPAQLNTMSRGNVSTED